MKSVHKESDHERMERLTQTFKSVKFEEDNKEISKVQFKSYVCTECGEMFTSGEEQKLPEQKHHFNNIVHIKTLNKDRRTPNELGEETQVVDHKVEEVNKEVLTMDEIIELTKLHKDEMEPSQEEINWMLMTEIRNDRKILASQYFPSQSNYKIEETCDICNICFYSQGNIKNHMFKEHSQVLSESRVIPQTKQTIIKPQGVFQIWMIFFPQFHQAFWCLKKMRQT